MFGIILACVAAVICILACLNDIAQEKIGGSLFFALLAVLNVYILVVDIKKYKNPDEYETHIVHNVEGYSVDSTMTINGTDTTKTYTLTYWK
jgi:hypothetical protein